MMAGATAEHPSRRRRAENSTATDRLPPHSPEAEQGVLGCILLSPVECMARCLDEFRLRPEMFYDLRHAEIFKALLTLDADFEAIDLITLQQRLKNRKMLEEIGGTTYLASLSDTVPSAANLSYYTEILTEKFKLRKIVQTCTEMVGRVYDHHGDFSELEYAVKSELFELISDNDGAQGTLLKPSDLAKFNPAQDENSLLGNRWLCRKGKAFLFAPSGIGKSTLSVQMAMTWAINRDVYGIKPAKALSSVIIGDENDRGDLAEMFQGVCGHLRCDESELAMLDQNVDFFHCPALCGRQFLSRIERWLMLHPRDIAWLDPLVSFADVDLTRQEGAAEFLRRGLSAIAERTGVIWIVIHHMPKPRDTQAAKGNMNSQSQYAGAGSYDLAGWARSTMTLEEAGAGAFRLRMGKRGNRSGALHPNGEPAEIIWLKRGHDGIYWKQIEPPEEAEASEKPKKERKPSETDRVVYHTNLFAFLSGCISPNGEGLREISRRLSTWLASQNMDLSRASCDRVIRKLVETKKLTKNSDERYLKGPEA